MRDVAGGGNRRFYPYKSTAKTPQEIWEQAPMELRTAIEILERQKKKNKDRRKYYTPR
jgi:hypothetical protein